MSDYNLHKISVEQAKKLAEDLYGINGKSEELPGESDFNFKITDKNHSRYILKISRPDPNIGYLEFQQDLLSYLSTQRNFTGPGLIPDKKGNAISSWVDNLGHTRKIRLLTWIDGRLWDHVNPQLPQLRNSLGKLCGKLTRSLQKFDHPEAHRPSEWDIAQSLWTQKHIDLFSEEDKLTIQYFQALFEKGLSGYSVLRKQVVHNDANSHNSLVSNNLITPEAIALIDYGDAIHTQVINDVAITAAYAIMGHEDPLEAAIALVEGYHSTFPLHEEELAYLYVAIAMRMIITITKSAINKAQEPDNEYLLISEKPPVYPLP